MTLARPLSGAGGEFRALLGFGAILIALPILVDAAQRRRLLAGLAGLALALGLWGIVQFAAQLHFYDDPDGPIAAGSFLTAGRVIGLFAFPVAAIVALAVLTGAPNRRLGARALLGAVVVANCVAIVLTFERTFVVATLVGFALVFLRSVPRQRVRLLAGGTVAVASTAVASRWWRLPPSPRTSGASRRSEARRTIPPSCTASRRAGWSRSRSAPGPSTARRSARPS